MKKRLLPFVFAIFYLVLSACGGEKEEISFADLSIQEFRNVETGATISLGMPRTETERILGEGRKFELEEYLPDNIPEDWVRVGSSGDENCYVYGLGANRMMITYQDECVSMLAVTMYSIENAGSFSDWRTKDGLTYGHSKNDMIEKFGEKKATREIMGKDGELILWYEYYFDASESPLVTVTDDPIKEIVDSTYAVEVCVDNAKETILALSVKVTDYKVAPEEDIPE